MTTRSALFISGIILLSVGIGYSKSKDSNPAPEGMVWIPGGEFSMGAATSGHGSCEMAMPSASP